VLAAAMAASLISWLTLPGALADEPKKDKGKVAKPAPAAAAEPVAEEPAAPVAEEAPADEAVRRTALVSRMILKVVNPEDARELLKQKAQEAGGFPVLITDGSIELKVPPDKLSELIAFAAENGVVVEKSLERQDLTQEIAQLEGQLKSKHGILARLRGFFDDSNVQATLRIEQTMTSLVTEMESVKGRLRVLEERSRWAFMDISFEFKQRDRIIYINSPFEWLNTVNLDRFLEEF
jgi:hypothetical protein